MKLSLLFCSYILSFFYILFLIVLYFSKNRLDNVENKIYKKLLITNFLGIVIQLICEFLSIFQVKYLTCIMTKFLLIYFIVWLILFFLYTFEISTSSNNNNKRKKKISGVSLLSNEILSGINGILFFTSSFSLSFSSIFHSNLEDMSKKILFSVTIIILYLYLF